MIDNYTIARGVRIMRRRCGLKQYELARRLGVTPKAISLIECGMQDVTKLDAFAKALNTTASEIKRCGRESLSREEKKKAAQDVDFDTKKARMEKFCPQEYKKEHFCSGAVNRSWAAADTKPLPPCPFYKGRCNNERITGEVR